jgi:hypothetical protein
MQRLRGERVAGGVKARLGGLGGCSAGEDQTKTGEDHTRRVHGKFPPRQAKETGFMHS